jgi:hypothetical protein
MEYAQHLFRIAAELRELAETADDDVVYDELIVAANVCQEAATAIELHAKAFAA